MRGNLESMFQSNGGPIQGKAEWVKRDVSHLGEEAIENEIKKSMDKCVLALILLGQDVHNSPWIEFEVYYAFKKRMICIGIEHPHGNYVPPNVYSEMEVLPWDPDHIAHELNQLQ